ncbi:blue-light-activated protein [Mariprofundus micogutta]|uniref:histidine kinase n=1 Tax=Mariprofundus micogutta TaxID=1921010 RepID=A0A1L8CP92_9PROT|nr:ATP-binding protein [Mariprofundus micogutta]GAV20703.1 blue-light-activated protein [Mariprofundus micogutta]
MNKLEKWMHNDTYSGGKSLAEAQIQQTKARILLTIASLTYVILHGPYFEYYMVEALTYAAFYFVANGIALIRLRRQPFSIYGSLFFPLLDVGIITFGMLIDGGHSSGIYLMLFPTIIGNGLRFGNPLLVYTQVASLIGMLISTSYGHFTLLLPIDYTLLSWQVFSLLAVPFYVYLIGLKLEKAIKEKNIAEETSFQLLDQGPLPVFTYEIDQQNTPRILYSNAAVQHTFQNNGDYLIGKPVNVLTLEEDAQEMLEFCRTSFDEDSEHSQHTSHKIYIRGQSSSGDVVKLMISAMRMRWHDNWVGVCFMLDITERETLQDQLELMHRQGYMSTLVAGIVHDFRNVLTNMIGYAEVLHMSSSDEVAQGQINEIIAAGERGSDLITHLLKLSKNHQSDKHMASFTKADQLAQPLENIIGLTRLQLPQNIKLTCHISQPLNDVAISIIEIEQILLNLVNNSTQAIKDSGTIRVEIGMDDSHKLATPGHPALSIRVIDNGEGINQEDKDLIFKAFWTSRDSQGGSGLGLTMVQRIIKLHHGVIDVTSEPGEETCFNIFLPPYIDDSNELPAENNADISAQPEKRKQGGFDLTSTHHVLLVDDAPDILKIHQAMLSHIGHSSIKAESGKEALELFLSKDNSFDLVITDFRMPGMNGLELVRELRKIGSNIPILMVTAFGEDEQLQQVGDYQVVLLNKPVTMEKLREGITECTKLLKAERIG